MFLKIYKSHFVTIFVQWQLFNTYEGNNINHFRSLTFNNILVDDEMTKWFQHALPIKLAISTKGTQSPVQFYLELLFCSMHLFWYWIDRKFNSESLSFYVFLKSPSIIIIEKHQFSQKGIQFILLAFITRLIVYYIILFIIFIWIINIIFIANW